MKLLIIAILFAAGCMNAAAAASARYSTTIVPTGTRLTVSVSAPILSNVAKTGDAFAFIADQDLVIDGKTIIQKGAAGKGTVVFAGAAGGHGHEGDLHLRFDTIATTLDTPMTIGTEVEFNGKKQKTLGKLSGVTWFTGFGQAVRGGQATVAIDQPIELELAANVCIAARDAAPCPPPAAAASPTRL